MPVGDIVFLDRAKETSTTTGSGNITLNGAVAGFVPISGIGSGNVTCYVIEEGSTFEIGQGIYNMSGLSTASGNTLSRDTIFSSSKTDDSKIDLVGNSTIFITLPADKITPLRSGADGNFDSITFSDAIDIITPTNTGTIKIGNDVGTVSQSGMRYTGGRHTSSGLNTNAWLYIGGGSRPVAGLASYQGDLYTYQVGDRVTHTGNGPGSGSFEYVCTYDDPGGGRDLDSQYWNREDFLKNPAIIKADLENKMMVIGDTDGNMDNYPSGATVTIVPKSQVDTALIIRTPLPSSGGGTGVPDTAGAGAVTYVPNLTEWYSTTGSLSAWMRSNGILYCSGVRLVGGVDQFGFQYSDKEEVLKLIMLVQLLLLKLKVVPM